MLARIITQLGQEHNNARGKSSQAQFFELDLLIFKKHVERDAVSYNHANFFGAIQDR
jgi:hypothetical protein